MRAEELLPRSVLASILASIIALLIVLFMPGSMLQSVGLAVLLIFLGHTLTIALFPGAHDVSPSWRAVLSLGVSISAAAMLFVSQGIGIHAERIETTAGVISAFVFFLTGLAYLRMMDIPRSRRPSFYGGYRRALTSRTAAERTNKIMALILIALLAGLALALAHMSSQTAVDERCSPKDASVGTEERMISSAQASLYKDRLRMDLSSNRSASDSVDRSRTEYVRHGSPGSDKKDLLYPRSNLTAVQIAPGSQGFSNASMPAVGAANDASGNESRSTTGAGSTALPIGASSATEDMSRIISNQSSGDMSRDGSQSSTPTEIALIRPALTGSIGDGSSLPYQEIDLTDPAQGTSTNDISKGPSRPEESAKRTAVSKAYRNKLLDQSKANLGMGDSAQEALASPGGSKEGSSSDAQESGFDSSRIAKGKDAPTILKDKGKDAPTILKDISIKGT